MPVYLWEGRNRDGTVERGELEAKTESAVNRKLRDQGINVTRVRKKPMDLKLPGQGGVKKRDVVIFSRQFATMIDAGLPIVQCLEILGKQSPSPGLRKTISAIKERVEGGLTLSDAMKPHPKVFDALYINMIAAGEAGGILDTILGRLSAYLEKAEKLKSKVKGAMVYPIAVAIVAIVVIVILLWKVIPVFEKMFKDMGAGSLPKLTQIVINISHGFADNALYIFGAAALAVFAFTYAMRKEGGKRAIHKFMLRAPVFGPLLRKVAVARFSRTFGTLLSSGVPILDSMDICAKTAGNKVIEEAIFSVRDQVAEGKDVAGPLKATKVFPAMVVQMMGVGEQTGNMDQMLQKIADFYEDEVDVAVDALTSLLEPAMMVILGGIVGFVLIAMYMPIFEIAGSIKTN